MSRRVWILAAFFAGLQVLPGAPPQPVARFELGNEPPAVATTIVFVSEEIVAIARYPGLDGPRTASLLTFAVDGTGIRRLRRESITLDRAAMVGGLHSVSNGNILSKVSIPPVLYSSDLKKLASLPIRVSEPPVPRARFAAEIGGRNRSFKLFRLDSDPRIVTELDGEILSVSDDFLVVRDGAEARVETPDGKLQSSFAAPPTSTCGWKATLLGPNRILQTACVADRVIDFQGHEVTRLPQRDGWGFRYGQSADGSRVLFDNYTRRISFGEKLYESFTDLITLGMGIPTESKGELIQVVDTRTGGVCLEWDSPEKQLGRPGDYHADISPSGRLVATVSAEALSLYLLPAGCTVR
jgi:hypothetical protein